MFPAPLLSAHSLHLKGFGDYCSASPDFAGSREAEIKEGGFISYY